MQKRARTKDVSNCVQRCKSSQRCRGNHPSVSLVFPASPMSSISEASLSLGLLALNSCHCCGESRSFKQVSMGKYACQQATIRWQGSVPPSRRQYVKGASPPNRGHRVQSSSFDVIDPPSAGEQFNMPGAESVRLNPGNSSGLFGYRKRNAAARDSGVRISGRAVGPAAAPALRFRKIVDRLERGRDRLIA